MFLGGRKHDTGCRPAARAAAFVGITKSLVIGLGKEAKPVATSAAARRPCSHRPKRCSVTWCKGRGE